MSFFCEIIEKINDFVEADFWKCICEIINYMCFLGSGFLELLFFLYIYIKAENRFC